MKTPLDTETQQPEVQDPFGFEGDGRELLPEPQVQELTWAVILKNLKMLQ